MWDSSAPNCGAGVYEVYTYCVGAPVEALYSEGARGRGHLCDDVAFYAEPSGGHN